MNRLFYLLSIGLTCLMAVACTKKDTQPFTDGSSAGSSGLSASSGSSPNLGTNKPADSPPSTTLPSGSLTGSSDKTLNPSSGSTLPSSALQTGAGKKTITVAAREGRARKARHRRGKARRKKHGRHGKKGRHHRRHPKIAR